MICIKNKQTITDIESSDFAESGKEKQDLGISKLFEESRKRKKLKQIFCNSFQQYFVNQIYHSRIWH